MYKTISIQHQLPTNIIIAGSTNTGKSVLAQDLIKHRHILFDKPIKFTGSGINPSIPKIIRI
jgi:GTP-binding protein EngB required for normal cell division